MLVLVERLVSYGVIERCDELMAYARAGSAFPNRCCDGLMASILDGLGLEGSVLDGLAEWPASTSRREWFAITRQLIRQTIADMDLDPAVLAEGEEAFIGAGLL